MIKIVLISSLTFGILGTVFSCRGSRFFGAVKGIGFGLFFGMIFAFILYVLEFIEKSYF